MNETSKGSMPTGLRDSTNWYLGVDPLSVVDTKLVDYVYRHGGQELLDLGCGLGGYSRVLANRGRKVIAVDTNAGYVAVAASLGLDARVGDGVRIPLADKSVDTIFMIEVLEHIPHPENLLAELRRVARQNIIITVPNCSQQFTAPITFTHMLDTDHKNFFSVNSLAALLIPEFPRVNIVQVEPIDRYIMLDLLPAWAYWPWRLANSCGLLKDRFYFRLIADAPV
jgi:SAM-dependent methyltransferase